MGCEYGVTSARIAGRVQAPRRLRHVWGEGPCCVCVSCGERRHDSCYGLTSISGSQSLSKICFGRRKSAQKICGDLKTNPETRQYTVPAR